jgi:hypothetical protein
MNENNPYLLAPCVVLAATVLGTRQAYESAMVILPFARNCDNDSPTPPTNSYDYDIRSTNSDHGA